MNASGLRESARCLSPTYDNRACALEPYSSNDVIGRRGYWANMRGMGSVMGFSRNSLRMIRSVLVRRVSDFRLLACAYVYAG